MISYNELIFKFFENPNKTLVYNPKSDECFFIEEDELFDFVKNDTNDDFFSFPKLFWELFDSLKKVFIERNASLYGKKSAYNDNLSFLAKTKELGLFNDFAQLYLEHAGFYLHFMMRSHDFREIEASQEQYDTISNQIGDLIDLLREYKRIPPKLFELEEDGWNHDVSVALADNQLQIAFNVIAGQGLDAYKTCFLINTGVNGNLLYSLSNLMYITCDFENGFNMHSTEILDGYLLTDYLTEAMASSIICVFRKLIKAIKGMLKVEATKNVLKDQAFYSVVYIRNIGKANADIYFKKLERGDIAPKNFFYNFNLDNIKPLKDIQIIDKEMQFYIAGINNRESDCYDYCYTLDYLMMFYDSESKNAYCRTVTSEPFGMRPVARMAYDLGKNLLENGVPKTIVVDNIFDYRFLVCLLGPHCKKGDIKIEFSDKPLNEVRDLTKMEMAKVAGKA